MGGEGTGFPQRGTTLECDHSKLGQRQYQADKQLGPRVRGSGQGRYSRFLRTIRVLRVQKPVPSEARQHGSFRVCVCLLVSCPVPPTSSGRIVPIGPVPCTCDTALLGNAHDGTGRVTLRAVPFDESDRTMQGGNSPRRIAVCEGVH